MATATKKVAANGSTPKKAGAGEAAAKGTAVKKAALKKAAVKKAAAKKAAAKRPAAGKATAAAPEKDPQGGLTAAGRAAFARRDGSKLKPGVTKSDADMSPDDMKRKGSWAVRFYGRKSLPPLVDDKGEPTRFALSAHAWGEPVPKTEAEARRIAERGRQLLERHAAASKKGAPGNSAVAKKASAKKMPARKAPAKKAPAKKAPGSPA